MNYQISVLDDETFNLKMYNRLLTAAGYKVNISETGKEFLENVSKNPPDMAILDIRMPGMDGYEVCRRLRSNDAVSNIPVLFVSALDTKENRSLAFAAGADEFLAKPVREETLLKKIEKCSRREGRLPNAPQIKVPESSESSDKSFQSFKNNLVKSFEIENAQNLTSAGVEDIYTTASKYGVSQHQLALSMAEFSKMPYIPYLNPSAINYEGLTAKFCQANQVIPMIMPDYGKVMVICNPFDITLLCLLEQCVPDFNERSICITKPESMKILFVGEQQDLDNTPLVSIDEQEYLRTGKGAAELIVDEDAFSNNPILAVSQTVIKASILENASDIHIEPQKDSTLIRFRIDGDLHSRFLLNSESGKMLTSRFKVLADMDIAEQRRPQDGSFTFTYSKREYRLRIATSLTTFGEGLTLRLLVLSGTHPKPQELGMTARQGDEITEIAEKRRGLALIVGPTGSGKTTTAYSLLQSIDRQKRNIISVEDPIEYRMPYVTQQQINEKIDISFESLLKTSLRQDPDVLFLGEIRDNYSAQVAIDFSSTGRLTVATLHTTDAASTIFRLERLGISREDIADSIMCIIAQQLIRRLCPHCREIEAISQEEAGWLTNHTNSLPEKIARPKGCAICKYKGYLGREGLFEIIQFTPEMLQMIRNGSSIPEIRRLALKSGCWLFEQHAIQKVKNLIISPADAYLQFLKNNNK
ncbi:MAG: ATPase, T2SS/T4P/T4SS family [Planctomycetota bacterium]|jgi:type II secretory ATPase GspE/PulE/Tfp pilus assembly ATPase PilB-like protein